MTPESVEAELLRDVASLTRRGLAAEAAMLKQVALDLGVALDPIRLVPEYTALQRTGKSRRWLRDRFAAWEVAGMAEVRDGERWDRLPVLPTRFAYEEGRALAAKVLKEAS